MLVTRLLGPADAPELAGFLRDNAALEQHAAGTGVPLVIHQHDRIVGVITLQSVIRGAFQQAETVPVNLRSQKVLQRLGFEQYGEAKEYLHLAGRWQDNLLYQLLTPTPERVVTI
jgi:hypothetical protein